MRVELKDFQTDAVIKLHERLEDMRYSYERRGRVSSVCLSSITGSGKTVICAAVIEALFFGNDELGLMADPKATVLWVSDSPNLNTQTLNRFVNCSDRLATWSQDRQYLETIKNTFCGTHNQLIPGHVYFLSKDLLGSGNKLVSKDEENGGQTFWDMLDRTIKDPNVNLYLFIDEAHRGFGTSFVGNRATETIYSNLVNGYQGRASTPIVVGVTATPQRFEARMDGMTDRDRMARVAIDPRDVQESGLIKDTIEISMPEESELLEHQYLTLACERFRDCRERWETYCMEQHEPYIWPLLIVQVKDKISADSLYILCDQITHLVPGLMRTTSFAHVFGEHEEIKAKNYVIPYIRPELVQPSTHVQVLFAKEAISNGWDCPRAEVLYSQRNRKDPTYITQLIGRMVRSPLARRVDTDDILNSIACFLPQFDNTATKEVVKELTGETRNIAEAPVTNVILRPVTVWEAKPRTQQQCEREFEIYERAEQEWQKMKLHERAIPEPLEFPAFDTDPLITNKDSENTEPINATEQTVPTQQETKSELPPLNPADLKPPTPLNARDESFTEEEWLGIREAFDSIPVIRNPKKARSEFVVLLDTATLFANAGIDTDIVAKVNKEFAQHLKGEIVANEEEFQRRREEIEQANTRTIIIDRLHADKIEEKVTTLVIDDAGIAKAAEKADMEFGKRELTSAYRKLLYPETGMRDINLNLAASCEVSEIINSLKTWARKRREKMFDDWSENYDFLSDELKQEYRRLESMTESKLETHLQWPEVAHVKNGEKLFQHHITQMDNGLFPLTPTTLEEEVIETEFKRDRTVAFYRNPAESNSQTAFSIPYDSPSGRMAVHPDFIFFVRDHNGEIRPSIIDPHDTYMSDTIPKLKGYVRYLRRFRDAFIQVITVSEEDGELRALNLKREDVQEAIMNFHGDSPSELYRNKKISNAYR
nr:DEAD/DEAH box helicase family protein [uncultured Dysosmobacter sp.]